MVGDSGIAAETSEFQAEEYTCAPAKMNRSCEFRTRPKRNCSIGTLTEAFGTDLLRWRSTTDYFIAVTFQSEEGSNRRSIKQVHMQTVGPPPPEVLHDLADWDPVFDQVLRAACRVGDSRRAGVDAEVLVDRRDDFLHVNRAVEGVLAESVSGADGLAGSHAAAGQ